VSLNFLAIGTQQKVKLLVVVSNPVEQFLSIWRQTIAPDFACYLLTPNYNKAQSIIRVPGICVKHIYFTATAEKFTIRYGG
jgi:hypothetical protein